MEKAGFTLAAASEINANPKDTKNYPFGVWTLPPTLRNHAKGEPTPAGYDAAQIPGHRRKRPHDAAVRQSLIIVLSAPFMANPLQGA